MLLMATYKAMKGNQRLQFYHSTKILDGAYLSLIVHYNSIILSHAEQCRGKRRREDVRSHPSRKTVPPHVHLCHSIVAVLDYI